MNEEFLAYPYEIRPLSASSGFVIVFPDLPGCIADGESIEESVANGQDAVKSWILTAREFGDAISLPSSGIDCG